MPADRLFHARLGHSEKVSRLSDSEFRVWTQYQLSADDFGVMRAEAVQLQADNDALAKKPASQVQRAFDAVIDSKLLGVFKHQGRRYVYQRDWQTFQKVEYPRMTQNPKPPADAVGFCDAPTQELFGRWPGGKKKGPGDKPESSPKILQTFSESVGNHSENVSQIVPDYARVCPRETANGKRLTATEGSGETGAAEAWEQWRHAWEASGRTPLPLTCSPRDAQHCIAWVARYPDPDWRGLQLQQFFVTENPAVRKSPPSLGWFVTTWADEIDKALRDAGKRPASERPA
jgi:hypothetical protein